jgi:hypothetical protein
LTLRGKERLKTFEMGRIFGLKRDEVIAGWRKLDNQELHNMYSSLFIIRMTMSRRMSWTGHVVSIADKKNACRVLVGKPERYH